MTSESLGSDSGNDFIGRHASPSTGSIHKRFAYLAIVGCLCSVLAVDLIFGVTTAHQKPVITIGLSKSPLVNPASTGKELCSLATQRTNHSCKPRLEPLPRVYDMFLFNDELDMLEIRLQELKNVVDFFVIVEARITFTAKSKPLHFHENEERFAFVSHKIIHVGLDGLIGATTWDREAYHRNAMFERGLSIPGKEGRPGDILLTSDIDEIPRRWVIDALRHCSGFEGHIIKFDLRFFYYSFLIRASDNWAVKTVTFIDSEGNYPKAFDLRNAEATEITFADAGWHCSYCFADLAHFRNKMRSFSHTELNLPDLLTRENIVQSIHAGIAFFSHVPGYFTHIKFSAVDAPAHVTEHADRFHFLLDRTSPTAGLSDYWTDVA